MIWPRFIRRRWEQAEAEADAAEERLAQAKMEHAKVQRLAEEARQIKQSNGFAEAIRSAMGVRS